MAILKNMKEMFSKTFFEDKTQNIMEKYLKPIMKNDVVSREIFLKYMYIDVRNGWFWNSSYMNVEIDK